MLTSWRLKQLQTAYWLQYFSFRTIPFRSIPFCINSFPLVLLLLLLNGFTKNVGLLAVLSVMKKLLITIAHTEGSVGRESEWASERNRESEQMKTRNERNNIKSKRFIANMVPSIVNVCVFALRGGNYTLSYYWIKTWTFYEQNILRERLAWSPIFMPLYCVTLRKCIMYAAQYNTQID